LAIWIAKSYLPTSIASLPASISLPYSIFKEAKCLRKSLEYSALSNSLSNRMFLIKGFLLNSFSNF